MAAFDRRESSPFEARPAHLATTRDTIPDLDLALRLAFVVDASVAQVASRRESPRGHAFLTTQHHADAVFAETRSTPARRPPNSRPRAFAPVPPALLSRITLSPPLPRDDEP